MCAAAIREFEAFAEEESAALGAILGANPFVGLDARQTIEMLGRLAGAALANPDQLYAWLSSFAAETGKALVGLSEVAPEPNDKRFTDPAWTENPLYKRMMQGYLAWRKAMNELVDIGGHANGDWKTTSQERFGVTLLTEALAPTNLLPANPAALKRAFETGGASLLNGLRNFIDDLVNNGGMPSQVDKRPFAVGRNLAVTPGAVVHRGEIFELLQYKPAGAQVHERALLLVPPEINKYYIMDLASKRSLTEYAVAHGIQFFTMSWRNPGPEHRDWSLEDYVNACKEATAIVADITGCPTLNLLGICAGGITSSLLMGHLAALRDRRINAATLVVTMLDTSQPSMTGMFTTEETVEMAIAKSREKGVLDAASMARTFAWLRPNDLVWNYWVNNYLMGNDPAPYDILYWNADSTNLPAKLHEGFLRLMLRNPLVEAGAIEILDTPINLRDVNFDIYVLAGMTDHICAWRACHRAAQLFGGRTEFVLNSTGHVQSLVSPPGNFKSKYFVNSQLGKNADDWLAGATEHKGSWWDNWLDWLEKRSGDMRPAPKQMGSTNYPVVEPAPGMYVHQRPN
ncbi:MAG TPA: alpha/beta fold hydrolase [Candidatus Binataceae bacterium]|nr:alpha/beta fold hydrolase [Candidatus Binataceae bacterium]